MINKEKAIRNFLKRVEELSQLPLINDLEMNDLFGEEVASVLAEMERNNREEQVCSNCENKCCHAISCEFYASQFSQCPIYDFRPLVCRLHFCHKFYFSVSSWMEEISDIFFESLLAADRDGSDKVRFFDSPPLTRNSPDLIVVTSAWMNAVREGCLNPEYAEKLIRQEAEKYRIAGANIGMPI